MRPARLSAALGTALALAGCAGMSFSDGRRSDGLTFYDPVPHLLVKTAADCAVTTEVVALPGRERSVRFERGLGSADLAIEFGNGIITKIGQKTDTKIPETIGALTDLATAGVLGATGDGGSRAGCPSIKLYPLVAGESSSALTRDPVILKVP